MHIGNIVTTSETEETYFKICDDINITDDSVPTLLIGWEETKKLLGENVSILHKTIDNKLSWTFSPEERKVDYEQDLKNFKEKCYNEFGINIPYVYIDILHSKLHIIKKILYKIYSLKESFSYITPNNMIYIFGDNIIFGLDLNIVELIGIPQDKIISKIHGLSNSILIENEIFNKCKDLIKKLDNRHKLVPYIVKYGKYNEDNDASIICVK